MRLLVIFSLLLLAVLSACSLSPLTIASSSGEIPTPIVQESVPTVETEERVAIAVEHVGIEIGIGSPSFVLVQIAGTWPGLCAQLAEISQQRAGNHFEIQLLADPGPADCPPDYLGLPFGMTIPINAVELAAGHYSVDVHGLSAAFDVPLVPTVPVDPDTGAPVSEVP